VLCELKSLKCKQQLNIHKTVFYKRVSSSFQNFMTDNWASKPLVPTVRAGLTIKHMFCGSLADILLQQQVCD
jgi:hypothetical protein